MYARMKERKRDESFRNSFNVITIVSSLPSSFIPPFVRSATFVSLFLPFVGLFPLYYARPSRLQWSRVENRVGWKVHRESEDLFYFTIEEILPRIRRGVVYASTILSISSNHRNRSFVDVPLKYSVWTAVVYVTRLKRHFLSSLF